MRGKVAAKKQYVRQRDVAAAQLKASGSTGCSTGCGRTLQKLIWLMKHVPEPFQSAIVNTPGVSLDRKYRIARVCWKWVNAVIAAYAKDHGKKIGDVTDEGDWAATEKQRRSIWEAGAAEVKAWPERLKQIRREASQSHRR